MKQRISSLTAADKQRLEDQRSEVRRHIKPSNLRKLETAAGKLGALRAIIGAAIYSADQTYELQCLGIVFGDALAQELGCTWVIVEDELGRDPALSFDGTSVVIFPLTMLSKRIECGEEVDVFDIFNGVARKVEDLPPKRSGKDEN